MSGFDTKEYQNYKAEAKEKWGKTDAYKDHKEKTKDYSKDKWDSVTEGLEYIMAEFADIMKNSKTSESSEAQNLVKKLQNYISENYYNCTNEILSGLGQMYVFDERFKNNIDKHSVGTAEFISNAIKVYCNK